MANPIALVANVFKLRIGVAITLCALAGLAVTPGPDLPVWKIAVLGLSVLFSSAAAGAFNQYVERDLDAHMTRTRNRPFVTGALAPGWPWPAVISGILVASVAAAALVLNLAAAAYVFLGAFFYGIVYTVWLKRRSAWNIVIGGLAGSFAVLAGAAAIDPALAPEPVILAVVLFLWTPPHFWSLAAALRDDYAAAGVPMLPVVVGTPRASQATLVHTLVLVALSLVPALAYGLGPIYLAGAAAGGALFVWRSIQFALAPGRITAMSNFHASLVQLTLLLVGAMLDRWLLA
ncbi:MAG TPA: heme o synthase [Hyphomicrobiales bacterium]|nr:heme o synthase [Rhodobiaceae bacterium]HXK53301.1 heme o synthase [Hyphomicrobiales bacterium]